MPQEQPVQHPINWSTKIWLHTQHNHAKQYS